MKNTLNRVLALALTLALCAACVVTPASAATFTDVSSSKWYAEAIEYVSENGYMVGTSDTTFSPNTTLTRAMFVTILYRMSEDYGNYSATTTFTDVKTTTWYAEAVAWAVDKEITAGTGNNKFSPTKSITREEMACFLWRYVVAYNIDLNSTDNKMTAEMLSGISSWAKRAVTDMYVYGIMVGDGKGNLCAGDTATRAEAAQVIMSFDVAQIAANSCTHSYVVTESCEPGCIAAGYIVYECELCGKKSGQILDNVGHEFDESATEVLTPATCTEYGSARMTCIRCGTAVYEIEPTGHTYVDGICTVCGASETE